MTNPPVPQRARYYCIRQCGSGKIVGSRSMSHRDAVRECAAWRNGIGLAAIVPVTGDLRRAVRAENQQLLAAVLTEHAYDALPAAD